MQTRRDAQTLLIVAAILGAVALVWTAILWQAGWF